MSAIGPLPGLQPGPLQQAHGLVVAPALPSQGPPPGADAGPAGPASGTSDGGEQQPIQILKKMIGLAHTYIGTEKDAIDRQTMAKVLTTLTGYLANEQKEQEAAMGTTPAMRFMQKAQ